MASTKRFTRFGVLLILLLVSALLATPLSTASASALPQEENAQEGAAQPLFLGQYIVEDLANGETRDYTLTVEEAAVYETRIINEDDALAFDLVITDESGAEIFNDIFGKLEFELSPGAYNLHFEAVDNAQLAFAMLGNIGDMTEDIIDPGSVPPGSIFTTDSANDTLYAFLTVPETPYPQQVTIYFEAGSDSGFYVTAEGDNIGYVDAEAAAGETGLLRFFTHGGDFLISAEPDEAGAALTLIPFLSGPPTTLTPNESVQGIIPAGEYAVVFSLTLDAPLENVVFSTDSILEDVDITVVDHLYDGNYIESSYGDQELQLDIMQPGVYYVIVETYDELEEDTAVELSLEGVVGEPLEVIEAGDVVEGEFAAGDEQVTVYIDVPEAGSVISLALSSQTEDSDFDLEAGINLDQAIWSTYDIGSDDTMRFLAPMAGRYFLRILSNQGEGDYALTVEDLGVATQLTMGDTVWGTVEEGQEQVYSLSVEDPGSLLSIVLVGQKDLDLDLQFSGYDEYGGMLAYESGYSSGPAEIVSAPLEEPGMYEVVVSAEYSAGGDYVLRTFAINPNQIVSQWAVDATASTQYGDDSYSAAQTTGAPNTPIPGDYSTAWAPGEQDAGEQTLELTYADSVVPGGVNIYESYNPGAVIGVEAYDEDAGEWVLLWEGEPEPVEERMTVFSPELDSVDFRTNLIRLTVDTDLVTGWNEIDAVELLGRP